MFRYFGISLGVLILFKTAFSFAQTSSDEARLLGVAGESVMWIDDVPLYPEDLVGRVYYVENNSAPKPFFLNVNLSAFLLDDPSVTESIVKKSGADGTVTFGGVFSLSGQQEKAFEFQVVEGKRWVSRPGSKDYASSLFAFKQSFVQFDKPSIKEVFFVQGVIKKKIWYKSYKKKSFGMQGTYLLNIGGSQYVTDSSYKEISKYGLLLVPLKSSGLSIFETLPAAASDVAKVSATLPDAVLSALPKTVAALAPEQSLNAVTVEQLGTAISNLNQSERAQVLEGIGSGIQ